MTNTTRVRKHYDRWAGWYDRLWHRYLSHTVPRVVDRVHELAPASVLDVGCGTGEFERLLLPRHKPDRLVGVDISDKMLRAAREKVGGGPEIEFRRARARALPFEDDSFDCVVSASALHYFRDPTAAVREMRRVMRPGGRLVLLDWCRDYLSCRLYDRVLGLVDTAYRRCYTLDEMRNMLTETGFAVHAGERYRFDIVWGIMLVEAAISPGGGPGSVRFDDVK